MVVKQTVRKIFQHLGYDLRRLHPEVNIPASAIRPCGNMRSLLEDLSARGFMPKSILDIGANQGDWSRMAKKIFPDANCFLIEPLAEMESFLEKFCEENPGSQYFLVGAGAEIKELTFTVQDHLSGSNFLYKESAQLKAQDKQRSVKVISIRYLFCQTRLLLTHERSLELNPTN